MDEDGTTPLWKGYRGIFTKVPRRNFLCGLEIGLRENATTHNHTPQKLPHTNSPMAYYHQDPNGNLNSTKKCLYHHVPDGKIRWQHLTDLQDRRRHSRDHFDEERNKDEPQRLAPVELFARDNELAYSLGY